MRSEIHSKLHASTSAAHNNLHVHRIISELLSQSLSNERYEQILGSYHAFYNEAEKCRMDLSVFPDFSLSASVADLAGDVNSKVTDHPDFSWVDDPISCLGVLYVLHGSLLGAKVIRKSLRKNSSIRSMNFFSREMDLNVWKSLVNKIEDLGKDSDKLDRIIESANRTFSSLGEWVNSSCRVAQSH